MESSVEKKNKWADIFSTLAWFLVMFQIVDSIFTKIGLNAGYIEANPFWKSLAGSTWFLVLKPVIACGLLYILYKRVGHGNEATYKKASIVLGVLNVLYVGVVVWNAYICGMLF